jgi:hypothetical protein
MDEQKPKKRIQWVQWIIIGLLIVGIFKLVAIEKKVDEIRVSAFGASRYASEAADQCEQANSTADDALRAARDAADYASNCPGN